MPSSITYPLTPPAISGIGPQDFTMALQNLVSENVSPFTFGEQEFLWPGDMLTIEASLPPMLFPQAEQWISFLNALFGKYGTFLMGDYNRPTPQGQWSGNVGAPIVVAGTNPSGANVLNLRGFGYAPLAQAVAGDYIQVTAPGGLQRLYKVLQNAGNGFGTTMSVFIRPSIREVLTDGVPIVTTNCAGTFRLSSNQNQWKIDKNRAYASISFKAREAGLV
jgi:hypothetical protein